jgi:hypothetical protein
MTSLAPFVATTQQDQHTRAVTRPTFNPELPTDHRCAQGSCATPPPPPPVQNEAFRDQPASMTAYWTVLATLTATLAAMAYLNRK